MARHARVVVVAGRVQHPSPTCIADLQKFCGSATLIPVSRVWLEQMGASIQGSNPTPHLLFLKNQKQNKKSSLYISKSFK